MRRKTINSDHKHLDPGDKQHVCVFDRESQPDKDFLLRLIPPEEQT